MRKYRVLKDTRYFAQPKEKQDPNLKENIDDGYIWVKEGEILTQANKTNSEMKKTIYRIQMQDPKKRTVVALMAHGKHRYFVVGKDVLPISQGIGRVPKPRRS